MTGNAQKLIKYMDGASKRFIIPVYQRNYDWKTEHCKQLYDDLVKVIRQNRKSHFFGSIVSVQSETGSMEEFLIIDGQQRLTTVSLLLLAIYHLFDFLLARKESIEAAVGAKLIWCRMDDNKASKIYASLPGVDVSNDGDWPRMAKFHAEASKMLYLAFKEPLEQYFNVSL